MHKKIIPMFEAAPESLFVRESSTVQDVITVIDHSRRLGIALVVDQDRKLLNTLTDGDVRRGILRGLSLSDSATKLLEIKKGTPHPLPVVGLTNQSQKQRIGIMQKHGVRQLPIIDKQGRVVTVESLNDLFESNEIPLNAVVMAGGFGKRLFPLTSDTPKPMLPVGGRPVLEHIVNKLSSAGIHHLHFTTYYRPEKIVDHFGNGKAFGVDINYINEDSPLGTAGALSMMPKPDNDVLVMNGDVISEVDLVAMYDYHRENNAVMTLGVLPYEHTVPFGVVEFDGSVVSQIVEKPTQRWFVNGGIYILSPLAFEFLKPGERTDMPDLINRILGSGKTVVSFPIREQWIDIGQHADYERANRTLASA
ncbi:MAG: nucleotidyltransferase family protein [Opitutaceae bacterium]|jgi:dTDP-glucose pyrophosphorylase/CBS domain-containing protein